MAGGRRGDIAPRFSVGGPQVRTEVYKKKKRYSSMNSELGK